MAKSDHKSTRPDPPQGLARHLEGWQPGLLAVALAGTMALLAVPRSVDPVELPLPMPSAPELRRSASADDALASAVAKTPLDADVRALGSLLRAFGKADADRDEATLVQLRSQIATAVLRARLQGDAALVSLRAYQLHAFIREVRRFAATGEASGELVELAGPVADVLVRNGWCTGPAPCKMHAGEPALRALFKRRWNEISGLSGAPFDLTLDEQRAFYELLLRHPPDRDDLAPSSSIQTAYLLKKVDELHVIDPSYPWTFARGVLLFRKGEHRRAAELFSAHLEASPDGPWNIRAQNHLRAALERSSD